MSHVHILGVCGTFMAGVAALARELGHRVTGSDRNVYPPMSDQLARLGVELVEGYEAAQLEPAPDVVVVGNVMSRGMPVVEALLDSRIPYVSGPEWLAREVLRDRWVVGVAGTHGKTTTTSLLAWILRESGGDPGYLIGGVPEGFDFSARLGSGPAFIIEADEYDTAFFDKRAKFLLYRPRTVVINNLEFDHADIYADLESIIRQFHQLVRSIPGSGRLIVPAADPNITELLARGCWTPRETFASSAGVPGADWVGLTEPNGVLRVLHAGTEIGQCAWRLPGAHNAENAVAALLAARHLGVSPDQAIAAIATFPGVRRRLQHLGCFGGVDLYDDFAHHPTAIRRTLEGFQAPGGGRVLAVLEPRSNSMRLGVFREPLAEALARAARSWVYRPPGLSWDLDATFADSPAVAVSGDVGEIVDAVAGTAQPGDAVIVMSNGDFQQLHGRLSEALSAREHA